MPQRSTTTISTLLVDDEPLAREELAFLLKDFPDIEVIDTATNGLEAVEMIESLEPGLQGRAGAVLFHELSAFPGFA